jgi:hypothetical protein
VGDVGDVALLAEVEGSCMISSTGVVC